MSTNLLFARYKDKKKQRVDKKQNIKNKDLLKQAGENLLKKVRLATPADPDAALASWQELEARLEKPHLSFRSKRLRLVAAVAASVVILLMVSTYWMQQPKETSMSIAMLNTEAPTAPDNEITLIANNDKMQLKDASSILYEANGKSNVEEHLVKKENSRKTETTQEEVNQIIVPKGRKVDITFSDGTKMYVNAGSRVIYPAVFRKDRREIVVEGEVYLDVKKDPSRPFIVKTKGFDVKVLGTQFNICAYKEEASASVVLVNGQVEVETAGSEKSVLAPNQLIEINEKGTDIKEVDVFEYICWKDNMMMLYDRKAGETLDKLARYYGCNISYDNTVSDLLISGKLDLREDPKEVINIICQSLFLKYTIDENNSITVTK